MTNSRALFVNGTVGSGKSAAVEHMGDLLAAVDDSYALLDLDWLRRSEPVPESDPFNLHMELVNLAAVAGNYRAAGVRTIVVAGVLEDPTLRPCYEAALASDLVVARIEPDLARVTERLRRRHVRSEDAADLDWHLRRTDELYGILCQAGADDYVVDVEGETPREVARLILQQVGWLPR
ncbi:MAG: hypothetical protein ACRDQA_08465 [Nocardioidaceae bacterium]